MNWSGFWKQLFVLSMRSRVRNDDRYRMKRLVRELRRDEQREELKNGSETKKDG
jgi:hypothetical protein